MGGKGAGAEYQALVGPGFVVGYTFAGIFVGYLADHYERRSILCVSLFMWSTFTWLTALGRNYGELWVTRIGVGIFESGCTPVANGIIADLFAPELRGTANGLYNWGIYFGYSMSYALGNFVAADAGWRMVFLVAGIPGCALAILTWFTVKEPERGIQDKGKARTYTLKEVSLYFCKARSLLLLCLAGAVRNAGGYVWAFNTQPYFEWRGLSKVQIGTWMSWIPLVAGSLGSLFGGFISDRVVKKHGLQARIVVLVVSQLVAAPFCAGALLLRTSGEHPSPLPFLSLIPANVIGEMWVGVTLTVVMELVPAGMRGTAIAVYLFIISNIGGNANVLVTPLRSALGYDNFDYTLLIMYPGMYVGGAVLFLLALFLVRKDAEDAKRASIQDPGREPLLAPDRAH